jgi:hypothetical protein
MQKFFGAAQDKSGNALGSATVTVYLAGTTTTASIFSDNVFTVKANPFTGDADGSFEFYAGDGRYDVKVVKTGFSFDTSMSYDTLLDDPSTAVTPTQIAGDVNNYSPTNGLSARVWRLSTDTSRTVTGIAAGKGGQPLVIVNVGSQTLILANQNSASDTTNRIVTGTGSNLSLAGDGTATLLYDGTTGRWRVVN